MKCRIPAPFAKLRGNYRFQIHIHSTDRERMRNVIRLVVANLKSPGETLWIVDIDPIDML